jgi:hypothetical protein
MKVKKVAKPPAFATETSVFNLQTSNDPIKVIPPAQMDIMPLVTEILTTYLLHVKDRGKEGRSVHSNSIPMIFYILL